MHLVRAEGGRDRRRGHELQDDIPHVGRPLRIERVLATGAGGVAILESAAELGEALGVRRRGDGALSVGSGAVLDGAVVLGA